MYIYVYEKSSVNPTFDKNIKRCPSVSNFNNFLFDNCNRRDRQFIYIVFFSFGSSLPLSFTHLHSLYALAFCFLH